MTSRDRSPSGGGRRQRNCRFDTPFVGLYTTFTQRNFFADALLRWDFYHGSSSSPGIKPSPTSGPVWDFSDVKSEARGLSVTANAGYQIPLMSGWFIEPSVGAVWSRVEVDPITIRDSKGFGGIVRM